MPAPAVAPLSPLGRRRGRNVGCRMDKGGCVQELASTGGGRRCRSGGRRGG